MIFITINLTLISTYVFNFGIGLPIILTPSTKLHFSSNLPEIFSVVVAKNLHQLMTFKKYLYQNFQRNLRLAVFCRFYFWHQSPILCLASFVLHELFILFYFNFYFVKILLKQRQTERQVT